jgi:hypothetical protein
MDLVGDINRAAEAVTSGSDFARNAKIAATGNLRDLASTAASTNINNSLMTTGCLAMPSGDVSLSDA